VEAGQRDRPDPAAPDAARVRDVLRRVGLIKALTCGDSTRVDLGYTVGTS
jgi:hypothetical protein